MNKKSFFLVLLWGASLTAIFIAAIWIIMWLTSDGFGESARIFQAIVTALAIVSAAAFAIFKLQIFRDFAPHLTISQKVSHRRVGESYIHIDVVVTLRNSSRVKVELRESLFLLQKIAPANDAEIEALHATVFIDRTYPDILWPVIGEMQRSWNENSQVIEPGAAHQEVCEFIVTADVKSVLAYTYFYNPYSSTSWAGESTSVHDLS